MHVIVSGNVWVEHIDSIITIQAMRMGLAFSISFLMCADENWGAEKKIKCNQLTEEIY